MLSDYDKLPALINLNVTASTVEKVATCMQEAAGPGRVGSVVWQEWLPCFGCASFKLRNSVANLIQWLANTRLHWAAYCAIDAGCLITLDKCLGIHCQIQRDLAVSHGQMHYSCLWGRYNKFMLYTLVLWWSKSWHQGGHSLDELSLGGAQREIEVEHSSC
eukprot:12290085-Ditylum_brightwellii.AAC.1